MKTVHIKKTEVNRRWLLVDAKDKVLGRIASQIANILRGKHQPKYTPNVDTGDFVVVINAAQVRLTGNKGRDKIYYDYSGSPGGLRERTADVMRATRPADMIRRAVKGMLPTGPLAFAMIKKLKVYAGAEHPHTAQKPELIELEG